ncbi:MULTISPECIES: hypothetical protein [unclassified Streptomyces]|uniref:hypothetical protein n=1 Tax=unclassified Streptomyces TaxID=2593676 RepID=UPI00190C50F9|nr:MULTISPECIES: hypothetical protein [unclassified Streptomyces]MBK3563285.1 hypothetical protein [Streptomyces sp. MBT62]MBK6012186.1 hypothetical protein [Streptomyces sp. MBT53]
MAETRPGPTARDDRAIIEAALARCRRGHHTVGTRPARPAVDDLVDARPHVRGTAGLRIVCCPPPPATVSGIPDGPIMATIRRPAASALDTARPRPDPLTDQ